MDYHYDLPLQKLGRYPQALEARIVELAKKQGGKFEVSPRWRDDVIDQACHRLKKRGVFKQTSYGIFKSYKLISNQK